MIALTTQHGQINVVITMIMTSLLPQLAAHAEEKAPEALPAQALATAKMTCL